MRQTGLSYSDLWYLEIGANHPISTSATYLLYERGARGTLIEPNSKLIPPLQQARSEDQIIHAAVIDGHDKHVNLHVSLADELSTLEERNLDYWPNFPRQHIQNVPAINIEVLLNDVWKAKPLNFLSIDTEGTDFKILSEIDFSRFPFDIVQIEPSNHIQRNTTEAFSVVMERFGYRLLAVTPVNCIFVRESSIVAYGSSFRASYDIYDTLIARRFVSPDSAIKDFCRKNNLDFERRMAADNGARSLTEIYDSLGLSHELMNRELAEESQSYIPIKENIERLRVSDRLVSDTYLHVDQLRSLLKPLGIINQDLHVSNSGKWTGTYWSQLAEADRPLVHIGDNPISDVSKPHSFGIRTLRYKNSELSDFEKKIAEHNFQLACLVRECRLRTLTNRSDIAISVAVKFNLPFLFAVSEIISALQKQFVFLGRDSYQLHRIYSSYYQPSQIVPFSRYLMSDTELAGRYLKRHVDDSRTIVDLTSTGYTWSRLGDVFDVLSIFYIDDWAYAAPVTKPTKFNFLFRSSEVPIPETLEFLNASFDGPVLEIDADSLAPKAFGAKELEKDDVEQMRSTSEVFTQFSKFYPHIAYNIAHPLELAEACLEEIRRESKKLDLRFDKALERERQLAANFALPINH